MLTKPLLMPLLIIFYLFNVSQPNFLIVIALISGFLGDVFLMLPDRKSMFLSGVAAFLAGHIFYIAAFLVKSNCLKGISPWFFLFLLPYIAAGIFLGRRLLPFAGSIKLPAALYLIVILVMSFTSLGLLYKSPYLPYSIALAGSLLFIVSDSLLAFDLFEVHRQKNHVGIMGTYILAQTFIVLGILI